VSPEEEQRRGSLAKQVLGNPVYQEAYAVIRERTWSKLAQAETTPEVRDRLNHIAIALESLHKYMTNVMDGGKMASEQIERDRTFAERVKDKIRSAA